MKRFTRVLLSLILSLVLVACSSQEGADQDKQGDEPLRVGLLVKEKGDHSFNDVAVMGMDQAKEKFGNDVYLRIFEYKDNLEGSFLQAAEGDFDVLVGASDLKELVKDFAAKYPDLHFWLYDTNFDFSQGDYDNVSAINYNDNESSYLAGYLAAKSSDTGIIGFVGGQEVDSIRNMYVGYVKGAQAANPDIKILSDTVGSWSDSTKARELADRMYAEDASIILAAAGGSSMGVVESAVSNESYVIGSDLDQAAVLASRGQSLYADVVATSILKKVDQSIVRGIERELSGEVRYGETVHFGVADDFVGLADNEYFKLYFDEVLRQEVKAIRESIIKKDIEVPSYLDMSEQEFEELRSSMES